MWVQLSVDQRQQTNRLLEEKQRQTSILLSTIQKLQEDMVRVRSDNEKLMQEHERILKSISHGHINSVSATTAVYHISCLSSRLRAIGSCNAHKREIAAVAVGVE